MPLFYCQIKTKDERRLWEIREAPEHELALACFKQDSGVSEKEIHESHASSVDYVLVGRLQKYLSFETIDPWGCKPTFQFSKIQEATDDDVLKYGADVTHDSLTCGVTNPAWHAARIRWLLKNPQALGDPICIDNTCHAGRVYPLPEIIDGWHRYYAHCFLRKKRIPVIYGGRVDLLDYLTGKKRNPPES